MKLFTEEIEQLLYEDESYDVIENDVISEINNRGRYSTAAREQIKNILINEIKDRASKIEFSEEELKKVALAKFYDEKVKEANGDIPYNLLCIEQYGLDGNMLARCLETIVQENIDDVVEESYGNVGDKLSGSVKQIIENELIADCDELIVKYSEEKEVKPDDKRDQEEIDFDTSMANRAIGNAEQLKSNSGYIADTLEEELIESTLDDYSLFTKEEVKGVRDYIGNACLEKASEQEITRDDIVASFENSAFSYKVPEDEFYEFFSTSSKRI